MNGVDKRYGKYMKSAGKRKVERWASETYAHGSVYNRNGTAYFRYLDTRKGTGLLFVPANKERLLLELDAWSAKILEGGPAAMPTPESAPHTMAELMLRYRVAKLSGASRDVRRLTENAVSSFFPEDMPLGFERMALHIADRRHELEHAARDRTKQPLSASTLHKRITYLRMVFRYAVDMGWLARNPAGTVATPRLIEREPETFTAKEVERILAWFDARQAEWEAVRSAEGNLRNWNHPPVHVKLFLQFLYMTGCRPGEALALQWRDVKPDALLIRGSKPSFAGRRAKSVEIPLKTKPFRELQKLLATLRTMSGTDARVFCWWQNVESVSRHVRECLADTGLQGRARSLKTFRAAAEERMRRAGLSDQTIAEITRHSTTIQQRYYKRDRNAEDIARSIARELKAR